MGEQKEEGKINQGQMHVHLVTPPHHHTTTPHHTPPEHKQTITAHQDNNNNNNNNNNTMNTNPAGLSYLGQMHVHLVAVEVCVVGRAGALVEAEGAPGHDLHVMSHDGHLARKKKVIRGRKEW